MAKLAAQPASGPRDPAHREVKCYFTFEAPGEPKEDQRTEFYWLYLAAKRWKNGRFLEDLELRVASAGAKERVWMQGKEAEMRRLAQWIEAATANGAQVTLDDFRHAHGEELKRMGVEGALEYFMRQRDMRLEGERMEAMAKAEEEALRQVEVLSSGLHDRRQDAAEYLLQLGLQITVLLQGSYRSNPELFREATGYSVELPVIASLQPGWVARAEDYLRAVGVGKSRADGKFSRAAYRDEVHIARRWARELVTCLDMNRPAMRMRALIDEYLAQTAPEDRVPLGSSASWKTVQMMDPPSWVPAAAELPDFCRETAGAWAKVARQVLRSEVPDLIERPEFASLVRSIQSRYQDPPGKVVPRPGTIANGLREKICGTIKTIAQEDAREA